ncbi:MAG: helix-turn-helix domain-containing protein [Bdellovibrio sp.]
MSRTVMIVVSENHEVIENTKKQFENHDVTVQAYTPAQWREGLDNVFFRQQLMAGVPALISGSSPVNSELSGNIIQFPSTSASSANVQKMEELEAHAIENAIMQYKGNLTEAAKALGIGRATLYRKVKQYHIDPANARKKKSVAA